ncbi:MAG: TIGR04282 family arsenosugar biosynthesis glycosyltransferase [Pseudomonadota bacterium]
MRPQLVIFARSPRLGAVKRRLARDIGDVAAWRFYTSVLNRMVLRLGRDPRWDTLLAVTGGPARWPAHVPRLDQGHGDLGDRMDRVMRGMPPGPVVIIGTDIPDISADHVARAFRLLGRHGAVFGPADDGGYWLIGLRRRPFRPSLKGPVRWSTVHALADTETLLGSRVSVGRLEVLTDVDDAESLGRWRRERTAANIGGYFS